MTDVEDTVPPAGVAEPGPGKTDVTVEFAGEYVTVPSGTCLLYTSPSPRD